jgi:hypothetical protein
VVEQHRNFGATEDLNSIAARKVDLASSKLSGFAISRLEKAGLKGRLTRKLALP